ncbi:exopolysaccharide biosynthesis protein [Shewanella hanedai]|uniref:protein-tyrosine-phosphatase n=1 Tax=Shewanella hanedai TaxID=25 RepID=A0A553JML6_SHEHA|nr:CpsB/CapC family capsule biosynthesis tyrosine phosphatase [Shewanella hanedai]TRY13697.1 capsule biosynthesis protein CapC [Shewanella hanedai]GGI98739.1 exopolysaccharide biosynthesis protein [Shewanella hanedai]
MIDIHAHVLPGIDDGAKDMDEALTLLDLAAQDGVTRMVVTPHLHLGRFDNFKGNISPVFEELKRCAQLACIDIELAYSAEVRLDSDIIALLAKNELPLYGEYEGKQFMLLELPHSHIPPGCDMLVKYLKSVNITPVIAHPERNRDLLRDPKKINPLVRLGCWFQLTASSIEGKFGADCQALALHYLERDIIQIVASDTHSVKRRPPQLSHAKAIVAKEFGDARAKALFIDNPYNITATLFS